MAYVGEFDALDNIYAIYAVKRVYSSYAGALFRLRRPSTNVELDFIPSDDGWPDADEINTFLEGETGTVSHMYDQSGEVHPATQTTVGFQPILDMGGNRPVIRFTASSSQRFVINTGASFAQNRSAVSMVAVRKHRDTVAIQYTMAVDTSGGFARAAMFSTAAIFGAQGRRLDADATATTTGLTLNTNWGVQIARFEYSAAKLYHSVDAASETKDPFQTAGATSNTASLNAPQIGAFNGGNCFNGDGTCWAMFTDLLTDVERDSLIAQLENLKGS